MTSNDCFDAASEMNGNSSIIENSLSNNNNNYTLDESETEDEEVRMNCVGGFRGIEDSDMNTTENSDDEEDDLATDDESSREGFRITHFIKNPYKSKTTLICPKPKAAPVLKRLSPLEEQEDEADTTDDRTNVDMNSDSYDSVDTKSDVIEIESSRSDIQSDLTDKALPDPYPQSFETELTEIMESIGDALELVLDESETSSRRCYIGVMKDVETCSTIVRNQKRARCHSVDLSDRVTDVYKKARSVTIDVTTYVRPITLVQASCAEQTSCSYSLNDILSLNIRGGESPALLSNDDDDLDRQLGEELCDDQYQGDGQDTPVPLLTPPGSPLTVEWEGASATLCEWPSNLIVDSAMQAVNELRPMSPRSLENLEREEHDRIVAFTGKNNGNEFMMMITPKCTNTTTTVSPPTLLKSVYA